MDILRIFIILLSLLTLLLAIVLLFGVFYLHSKGEYFSAFFHDKLGWHLPNDTIENDGCSSVSNCKICGKKIMQDSQGNWF